MGYTEVDPTHLTLILTLFPESNIFTNHSLSVDFLLFYKMIKNTYLNFLLFCLLGTGLIGSPSSKDAMLAKSGNSKPTIVKLSSAEEASILKKGGVSVPDGFEATLFAPWQAANYPVYVAAAPNGDLYVSSDG